jgi:hypothetical protein
MATSLFFVVSYYINYSPPAQDRRMAGAQKAQKPGGRGNRGLPVMRKALSQPPGMI